jgi:hypothetical protein
MKRIFATLIALHFLIQPAAAQETDGGTMMERGMQQFLEGLLQEMEPAMQGLKAFLEQMGPALADILGEVKDWSVYEPPEVLENGDIIIRRKPGTLPETAPDEQEAPQIEL